MRMTDERLEAFKKLYCDRFGILLTNEEALTKSLLVVRLMELTYKPMTQEELVKTKERMEQLAQTT